MGKSNGTRKQNNEQGYRRGQHGYGTNQNVKGRGKGQYGYETDQNVNGRGRGQYGYETDQNVNGRGRGQHGYETDQNVNGRGKGQYGYETDQNVNGRGKGQYGYETDQNVNGRGKGQYGYETDQNVNGRRRGQYGYETDQNVNGHGRGQHGYETDQNVNGCGKGQYGYETDQNVNGRGRGQHGYETDQNVNGRESFDYNSQLQNNDQNRYPPATITSTLNPNAAIFTQVPAPRRVNLEYETQSDLNSIQQGHKDQGHGAKSKYSNPNNTKKKSEEDIIFCIDCEKVLYKKSIKQHSDHKLTEFKEGLKELHEKEIEKSKLALSEVERLQKNNLETMDMLNVWDNSLKDALTNAMDTFKRCSKQNINELTGINEEIETFTYLKSPENIKEHTKIKSTLNDKLLVCQNLTSKINQQPSWLLGNMFKITLGMILEAENDVVCVLRSNDKPKFAPIELQGDRILVSSFVVNSIPNSSTVIIPYEFVSCLLEREDACAYMKLSYNKEEKGTILIRVDKETFSGHQFLLLCSGEKGATYRHTSFFRSCLKGKSGHHIWGGDYSRNDGNGGECVLKGNVPITHIPKPVIEGLVSARYGFEDRSTIFRIFLNGMKKQNHSQASKFYYQSFTSSTDEVAMDNFAFGQVVQGLDVISHISDLGNISKAKISAVGRVLALS